MSGERQSVKSGKRDEERRETHVSKIMRGREREKGNTVGYLQCCLAVEKFSLWYVIFNPYHWVSTDICLLKFKLFDDVLWFLCFFFKVNLHKLQRRKSKVLLTACASSMENSWLVSTARLV